MTKVVFYNQVSVKIMCLKLTIEDLTYKILRARCHSEGRLG